MSGIGRPLLAAGLLLVGIRMIGRSINRDVTALFGGDVDMPYAYEFGGYIVMVDRVFGDYTWLVFSPMVWGERSLGKQLPDYPDFTDAEAMGKTDDAHAAMDSANAWAMENG